MGSPLLIFIRVAIDIPPKPARSAGRWLCGSELPDVPLVQDRAVRSVDDHLPALHVVLERVPGLRLPRAVAGHPENRVAAVDPESHASVWNGCRGSKLRIGG